MKVDRAASSYGDDTDLNKDGVGHVVFCGKSIAGKGCSCQSVAGVSERHRKEAGVAMAGRVTGPQGEQRSGWEQVRRPCGVSQTT